MKMKWIVLISLALCAQSCLGKTASFAKQLAGPASEFADHQLPVPSDAAQQLSSLVMPLWVTSDDAADTSIAQDQIYTASLVCDSTEIFQFSFMSPSADSLTLSLTDPNGVIVSLASAVQGFFPVGQAEVPETSWTFKNPTVGVYTLTITSTDAAVSRKSIASDDQPFAYILVDNKSPITMVGYLNTYHLQKGQSVGLVATIVDNTGVSGRFNRATAKIMTEVITNAVMAVTLPDGTEEDVQMHDDGLHFDEEANDGIYGGSIEATEVGTYQAQAIISGKTSEGVVFMRSTQHLIASISDELDLSGSVTATYVDAEHIAISFDVSSTDTDASFSAYAEVYGTDSNGNSVAVCWIGGMTQVEDNAITLVLDVNWLNLAGATTPLTVKNVLVQDSNLFIPVSQLSSASVSMDAFTHAAIISYNKVVTNITRQMREGVFPEELKFEDEKSGVILVHGYCSSTNPWSPYPNDWTDAYYFLNAGASITHDEFAKKILEYAQQQGLTRYSIVGHSQGGDAATHLKNFYFSGLDVATGGKLIQTLGTPFEGNTAAGSAANIGSIFGIGCGTNFDLSHDGAKLWVPTITMDTRANVNFYTTTYKLGTWFGDSCNTAINMILEWPNDGTSELEFADLPGANNMGNTEKQCHTEDMNYKPQYYDNNRNKKMNADAAR